MSEPKGSDAEVSEPKGRGAEVSEPKGRGAEVSEPKGRGADWTEERGTSDEGRRHLKAPRRRASLDNEPGDVAAMFDAIAGRYDLLNDILSAGQVRLWRRAVARITGAGPGERVLDLAAGTGTSSLTFTATGADCVACDFSLGMLQPAAPGWPGPGGPGGRAVPPGAGGVWGGSSPGRLSPSWPATRCGCRSATGRSTR